MEKTNYDQKTCASCGEEFACGARSEKCWCFAVEISAATLAELEKDFNGCLCRPCLEKIESAKLLQQK